MRQVGRTDDDHPRVAGKAIHLPKQLVQGLSGVIVGLVSPRAQRVDFIDENDARGQLACSGEQSSHALRAKPREHLHERGAVHADEGNFGLPSKRTGQQRLSGPGRSRQQYP